MFLREKAESRINYYTAQIAGGRRTPFDPPRAIKRVIYVGFRHEILSTIKELIAEGLIAAATDEQICALFHCTRETDNADYEIENPVVLVWLGSHCSYGLTIKGMNKLGCFADRYYFEQFKNIITGTDFKPINDISDSASTGKPINQKILGIIARLRRRRESKQ